MMSNIKDKIAKDPKKNSKHKIITDLNGNAIVNISHPEVKKAMLNLMVELHENLPKK